ncbi:MAG: translation initiation factor Sui1 [Candidatus Latescibacterota bacterium]
MTPSPRGNSGLVYSTDHGRMCPDCGQPVARCTCRRQPAAPRGDGIVRVSRATQGRQGRGVTVVTGLPLDEASLADLARQLKQRCGAGGTVRDGVIEIQGEHRDALVAELQRRGFTVRRAGG